MGRPAVLKVDIVTDAKGAGRGVDEANSKLGRLGSTAGKVGRAVGVGLGVGVTALAGLAVASVKSASNVEQAFGAVDSVFGKSAGTVKRWASDAAGSVGLAKSEYANLAAVVGSQLNNMGRSQEQSAQQTRTLIGLGADLAATYGGTTREAVEALSSTLKGETDPIERYGVSIKQSDINARLAAEGLNGLTGKAAKQAQASAVLALVTEQTTAAHGQFAAQAGSLAEQQQILTARWENAKATLGQKLLPIAASTAGFLADRFIPAVQNLASRLQAQLGPAITAAGDFIRNRLVPATQSLYGWFVDKVVPAIRAYIVPALAGARSAFGQVSKSVDDNSDNLKTLGRFLGTVIPPVARALATIMGTNLRNNFRIAGAAISIVIGTISRLVGVVDSAIGKVRALASAISSVGSKVSGGFGSFFNFDFGFSNKSVLGMVGQTAGTRWAGPAVPGLQLVTAAGGSTFGSFGAGSTRSAAGVYLDRRVVNIRIDGAFDPVATARQIENILNADQLRTGRRVTYGAG